MLHTLSVERLYRRACQRCGSSTDLPHPTVEDCLHANSKDTREALRRSQALIRTRKTLTEQQHEQIVRRQQKQRRKG